MSVWRLLGEELLVPVRNAEQQRWPGSEALRFATSPDQRRRRALLGHWR